MTTNRSSRLLHAVIIASLVAPLWANCDAHGVQRPSSRQAARSAQRETPGEKTIAVLGSSVARGWVTSKKARHDLLNGYAFRLERLLKPHGWKVVNISKPGDDTKDVLRRIRRELLRTRAKIVIIGLSMSNEGLELATDTEPVFESYREGLTKIIQFCRDNDISPVVGLCYPNDNYDDHHYASIKKMNLLINTWDVPSINLSGPVDNGSGGWIEGYSFDLDHPDDTGHEEMFYAIVPSLFDSLLEGKPVPVMEASRSHVSITASKKATAISYVPEDVIHSFTLSFQVRPSAKGTAASVGCGDACSLTEVDADGKLRYVPTEGAPLTSKGAVTDGSWHNVVVSHRHLLRETELFVDGESCGTATERLTPRHFVLGAGACGAGNASAPADYRNLLIYRAPLNRAEVEALHGGNLIQSSLEVFAPLRGDHQSDNASLANLAQSMSQVALCPTDVKERIARLEQKIETAAKAERYVDPNEKVAVQVDPAVFDAYVGEFKVNPGLTLFVSKSKGRLLLSPNNSGNIQLHPESETEYFARIKGPRIRVTFVKQADGKVSELILHQGGAKIPAKRVR